MDNQSSTTRTPKQASFLTSLVSFPKNFTIYGQNPGENILLFVREHKIVLFFNIFFYTLIFMLPFFTRAFLEYLNVRFVGDQINLNYFFGSKYWTILLLFWTSYMLTMYFNIFFKWFYNINLLTTYRFVDIDFISIFHTRVEETLILDIEDAKDDQKGIFHSIFNMGDLELFTASGKTTFNLSNVPMAHKIRDFIMDVVSASRNERKGNDD